MFEDEIAARGPALASQLAAVQLAEVDEDVAQRLAAAVLTLTGDDFGPPVMSYARG